MFSEAFDIFSMIYYSLLGFGTVIFAAVKTVFSMPMLPFTMLGLTSLALKIFKR